MSVAPGRSVAINLSANATPYIASIRQATLATAQLQTQLRAAGVSSTTLASATSGTAIAQRAAATATTAATVATRAGAAASTSAVTATRAQAASAGLLRNAQGQFVSAATAATAATNAQTAATGRLRNAQGQFIASSGAATTATQSAAAAAAASQRALEKSAAAYTKIGAVMGGVGLVIAAGVGLAVAAFARFDKQLSALRAVSGATADEMEALSAAAVAAGASTAFSATEAARAQTELAKAGLTVSQILGGALTGALSLAAAGGLELGRAAEIAGQTMNVFGLESKDVARIADTLANGANKSAADVEQLSQAMSQVGLVANQTGLSMEDTVGVLAAFADNALVGSDAGTSLKSMLQRLTPQSAEAAAEMERLGLNAYDAQGNFVGITEYAGRLRTGLKDLTAEQRQTSLGIIFGSDAVRAATVLYGEGSAGIAEYVGAMSEVGTAALTAAIQMDNLMGDLEELKGALETAFIINGEGMNGPLREILQNVTDVIRAYNDLPAPVRETASAFIVAAGGIALIGGALFALTGKVIATRVAMAAMATTAPGAAAALTSFGKAAGIAGVVFLLGRSVAALGNSFRDAPPGIEAVTAALLDASRGSRMTMASIDALFAATDGGAKNLSTFADAVDRIANPGVDRISDIGDSIFGVESDAKKATETIDNLGRSLAVLVTSGHPEEAAALFDQMYASLDPTKVSIEELNALMPAYGEALAGAANQSELAAAGADSLSGALGADAESAQAATEAIDGLLESLVAAGLVQLSARDAARQWEQAIDDATAAVAENGVTLDITTQAGRNNQAALDDVADSAIKQAQAIYEATGSEAAFRESLMASRGALIASAQQFGLTEAEAAAFADTILGTPETLAVAVSVPGALTAAGQVNDLQTALSNLRDKTVIVRANYVVSGAVPAGTALVQYGSAQGGPVRGPGTSTSDSILRRLSDGEYVVKAAAVDRYGVAFFDEVNAMRFASGGYVRDAMTAARSTPAAPAGRSGPLVHIDAQYVADGRDAARAQQTAWRDAVAVHGLRATV